MSMKGDKLVEFQEAVLLKLRTSVRQLKILLWITNYNQSWAVCGKKNIYMILLSRQFDEEMKSRCGGTAEEQSLPSVEGRSSKKPLGMRWHQSTIWQGLQGKVLLYAGVLYIKTTNVWSCNKITKMLKKFLRYGTPLKLLWNQLCMT